MRSLILIDVDELILRTLVIQFDGRVVEIFHAPAVETSRDHVAFMKEPEILPPDKKGRSTIKINNTLFKVDPDEMVPLRPFLEKIALAIRAEAAKRAPVS